jgi:hypothetical protein
MIHYLIDIHVMNYQVDALCVLYYSRCPHQRLKQSRIELIKASIRHDSLAQ